MRVQYLVNCLLMVFGYCYIFSLFFAYAYAYFTFLCHSHSYICRQRLRTHIFICLTYCTYVRMCVCIQYVVQYKVQFMCNIPHPLMKTAFTYCVHYICCKQLFIIWGIIIYVRICITAFGNISSTTSACCS